MTCTIQNCDPGQTVGVAVSCTPDADADDAGWLTNLLSALGGLGPLALSIELSSAPATVPAAIGTGVATVGGAGAAIAIAGGLGLAGLGLLGYHAIAHPVRHEPRHTGNTMGMTGGTGGVGGDVMPPAERTHQVEVTPTVPDVPRLQEPEDPAAAAPPAEPDTATAAEAAAPSEEAATDVREELLKKLLRDFTDMKANLQTGDAQAWAALDQLAQQFKLLSGPMKNLHQLAGHEIMQADPKARALAQRLQADAHVTDTIYELLALLHDDKLALFNRHGDLSEKNSDKWYGLNRLADFAKRYLFDHVVYDADEASAVLDFIQQHRGRLETSIAAKDKLDGAQARQRVSSFVQMLTDVTQGQPVKRLEGEFAAEKLRTAGLPPDPDLVQWQREETAARLRELARPALAEIADLRRMAAIF